MQMKDLSCRVVLLGKVLLICFCTQIELFGQTPRARDLGIEIGVMRPGPLNALTDVAGIRVGHITLENGVDIRTGVTAILPHEGNMYQEKVPAAIYIGNGYGKLMGYSQVEELGNIETAIVLTNTLSVPIAAQALIQYALSQPGNESVRSVNPIVGETNDGRLNDIRGGHVQVKHVLAALEEAREGPIEEGAVGAGTGTICFGFKGGIGTASRRLPTELGAYTVGVLVQSNFGGVLQIDGMPVGERLGQYYFKESLSSGDSADGSIMVVVATDAPLDARNLKRLAKRAFLGVAKTGGIASNGSGDYIIAFSTHPANRISASASSSTYSPTLLHNARMTPLFMAAIEATEEAIVNSLLASANYDAGGIEGLPIDQLLDMIKENK